VWLFRRPRLFVAKPLDYFDVLATFPKKLRRLFLEFLGTLAKPVISFTCSLASSRNHCEQIRNVIGGPFTTDFGLIATLTSYPVTFNSRIAYPEREVCTVPDRPSFGIDAKWPNLSQPPIRDSARHHTSALTITDVANRDRKCMLLSRSGSRKRACSHS